MPTELERFIDRYSAAVLDGNAALFAGAGLSIPAGLVDWRELLRDVARDVGLDVRQEEDLIAVAQYHVNTRRGKHQINQKLIDEFNQRGAITNNHRLLASMPIRVFWTTNYDALIEQSLYEAGKKADVKRTVENLALNVRGADAIVYKMHGDVSLPHEAVVTKDDYETYNLKRNLFSMALQGDLVAHTFLFIGFSFSDPNLSYILGRIRQLLGENQRQHYSLLRRVQRNDFPTAQQYQYAKAKQELQVQDLTRYGIQGVLVDSYQQYTEALAAIRRKVRLRRVFISGSASTYSPWGDDDAKWFIKELSKRIVSSGSTIVSGFGLGVGEHVLNGVLHQLDEEHTRTLEGRLVLRPFPIAIEDPAVRKQRWRAYRTSMLSEAGVALFLFGNKQDSAGNCVAADGMVEEFELAVENGIAVVPVGSTGHTAKELYGRVMTDVERYLGASGMKGRLRTLGTLTNKHELVNRVVELLDVLRT